MAIAQYNAGLFTDSATPSSRTDPITLDGLVNATGGTVPLVGLTRNVAYENNTSTVGTTFSLGSGTYNFSTNQLTLSHGIDNSPATPPTPPPPRLTASKFQMLGQSGADTIVYVGYSTDVVGGQLVPLEEEFILNFDDVDQNFSNQGATGETNASYNRLLTNEVVLDVSRVSRFNVNLPTTSFGRTTSVSLGARNIFVVANNNALSQIRMTINMGRYANDVLVGADTRRGGPDLANSTQLYRVTSAVPVRDILYRGDYVDWRPVFGSSDWAPLTGGGFIGDHGIKWLIENQTSSVVTNASPLIFGSSLQSFELGIDSSIALSNATGDGYFELGLSPDTARLNRIVFVNPTGITWRDRLALWNNTRGRLRVEHHTTQPFHVSDDVEANVSGANVILHHFYPQYGSDTTFNAAPQTFFSRNVTSIAATDTAGIALIGNDTDANYSESDISTTVNRPIIVEALELNSLQQGTETTRIQRDYQSSVLQSNAVSYNNYRQRSASQEQATSYDVYAFGHVPLINQPISFRASATTADPDLTAVEQVVIQRDLNVTANNAAAIPGRAVNLNDVYDLVHNWAITNRRANPITVRGTTLDFGALSVVFDPNSTSTPNSVVTLSTANVLRIPTGATLASTTQFTGIQSSAATTPFTTAGVSLTNISIVGTNAPSITLSGFNRDTFINQIPGRIDIFDLTNGRTPTETFTGDGSNQSFQLRVSPLGIRRVAVAGEEQGINRYSLVGNTVSFTTAPTGNVEIEYVLNPIASVSGNFSVKNFTFDRSTSGFENMGSYTGPGRIQRIAAVYSRPGFEAEEIEIDVSSTSDRSFSFIEDVEPYPNNVTLPSGASAFSVSLGYRTNNDEIIVTLSGGGTNRVLTTSQTNRLLMDNIYGSLQFNTYSYVIGSTDGAGSRGATSYWFANGSEFTILAPPTEGLFNIGYIENTDPARTALASTDPVVDTVNGQTGTRGVMISQDLDRFDLQAVESLNRNTNQLIEISLNGFQGDDTPEEQADPSSIRTLRDELRSTRNTILGNI